MITHRDHSEGHEGTDRPEGREGASRSPLMDLAIWGLRLASAPILLAAILIWALVVAAGAVVHGLSRRRRPGPSPGSKGRGTWWR